MAEPVPVQIATSELRAAVGRLLNAVEAKHGATVDLDADHYWSLAPLDSFDLSTEPHVETSQLSDDVENTRDLLTRADEEVWLWHDLEHIAGIFLRLAALDSPRRPAQE